MQSNMCQLLNLWEIVCWLVYCLLSEIELWILLSCNHIFAILIVSIWQMKTSLLQKSSFQGIIWVQENCGLSLLFVTTPKGSRFVLTNFWKEKAKITHEGLWPIFFFFKVLHLRTLKYRKVVISSRPWIVAAPLGQMLSARSRKRRALINLAFVSAISLIQTFKHF